MLKASYTRPHVLETIEQMDYLALLYYKRAYR